MKNIEKSILMLLLCIFSCFGASTSTTPALQLGFESYPAVGASIQGATIVEIPEKRGLVFDKKRGGAYLDFNGRNDSLVLNLDKTASGVLRNSFTLEFDFSSSKLPTDYNFHNPGPVNIQVFSALDSAGQEVLGFYGNRYNRFNVNWVNTEGTVKQIQSTWNHKNNYELISILRNKWYQTALVYDKEANSFSLYLDGEKIGETKTQGDLREIVQFRFGGPPTGNRKTLFSGGIDNLSLTSGILHSKETDEAAQSASWQRLHETANAELSALLPREEPEWAEHHPRLLLTPARIAVLKETLKQERGPELVKRLIARCEMMITPSSSEHLKTMDTGHSISYVMRPAELCLATILTGEAKYAEHAISIVTAYAETCGYYDMNQQLVMSAGLAKPLMSAALTYDWGYDYFTPEQRHTMRLFFLNIAKGTYDFYTGDETSPAHGDALSGWAANWSALSISTLGNACLSIIGETDAPIPLWLDYAKFRAAQYALFATSSEGCFHEMPGYLAFGAGPTFLFMEALHTAGGDDLIMSTHFSKIPNWLPYVMYPHSRKTMPLKYSAAMNGLHAGDAYVIALLRAKLNSEASEWSWQHLYNNSPWAESWSLFPLIWFKPESNTLDTPRLPLAKWFKSEGMVGFRSDWTKDAVAGIFMAYPAKMVAHDQSDRGQFTLYGYQGRWIIDNGGRQQPEYAWRDAHNLITVDGNIPMQKARLMSNFHHDAFLTDFCSDDALMTAAEADLTQSYRYTYTWGHQKRSNSGEGADTFKNANRQLLFMREKSAPPYLLVHDSIQQDDQAHTYTLSLQTASENEVTIAGPHAEFHQYAVESDTLSYVCRPENLDASRRYYYSGHPDAGYAEYKILVPVSGQYDLYGFGRPGDRNPGGMDSFFISFGKQRMAWGTNGHPVYRWSKINESPLDLQAGEEILTVLLREPEARAARFALYPTDAGVPLFNKPNNPKLILVDAGKPDKLVEDFSVGSEEVDLKTAAADMTLLQLSPQTDLSMEARPGVDLPHLRLQASMTAVRGKFLNLFYPRRAGMERPELKTVSPSISRVQWRDCVDTIYTKTDKNIHAAGIESDADLVIIRKKGAVIVSFVMMSGSYLNLDNQPVITLSGGKGIAAWADDRLAVSGKNVSNFAFKFPSVESKRTRRALDHVTGNGNSVETIATDDAISAAVPFTGQPILTW